MIEEIFIEELCKSSYIINITPIIFYTLIANVLFFMFGNLIPIIKFKKVFKWDLKDLTEKCLLAFNIYIIFRFLSSSYLEWFIKYRNTIITIGIAIFCIWLIIFMFKNINLKKIIRS